MGSRTTIRDIADHVGASPATVSAALRNDGRGVTMRPETRERIVHAAEVLGYDYKHLRMLPPSPPTISVFCPADPHPNVPMLYRLLTEVSERLAHHGFRMALHNAYGPSSGPTAAEGLFGEDGSKGAIVLSMYGWAEAMESWPVPSVFLGPVPMGFDICTVNVDDVLGGSLAAEHLLGLGHTRIGVAHMWQGTWARSRERGFMEALQHAGREIPRWAIRTLSDTRDEVAVAEVRELIDEGVRRGEPLTALFCDADWLAAHALRAARGAGLRVPQDISIIGFDDAHFATVVDPPLTTVRQPFSELAALAVSLLMEQLQVGGRMIRSYSLPCELVRRGSSGPVGGDRADQ